MLVVSLLVWGNFTVQHSRGLYEGFWPLWRPFENVKCLALQLYRSASACWHTTWQQKRRRKKAEDLLQPVGTQLGSQLPEVGQAVFQKDPAIRLLVLPTFLLLGGSHMKRPRLSVQVWSEFWLLGVSHQYLADAGQLENLIIPTWQHSQIQQIFWLIFQGHSDF